MRFLLRLILAQARQTPARLFLTGLAMIAAACVVVWVVSGYETTVAQFDSTAGEYLGRYDLFVVPDAPDRPAVAAELIDALRADPAVAEVEPVSQTPARVLNPESPGPMGGGDPSRSGPEPARTGPESGANPSPSASLLPGRGPRGRTRGAAPMLVGTDATQAPYAMLDGVWIDARHPERREAVLSNGLAQQLEVAVGDSVLLIVGTKEYRLKVIGLCTQVSAPSGVSTAGSRGSTTGPAVSAVYVPRELASQLTRQTAPINLVNLKLKPGTTPEAFRSTWQTRLADARPPALMLSVEEIKAGIEEAMATAMARRQAWAATAISLVAALFIIFTTLSMGVHERVRQLAILRAVALTRRQVALLVVGEGVLLALLGWGGGLVAGWGLLELSARARPEVFPHGVSLGAWCVVLSGIAACCGALGASIVPAWQATRVAPLDALSPRRPTAPASRRLVLLAVVGLVLVAVHPLVAFVLPVSSPVRYGIYEVLGSISMAIGFLMLAPLTILVIESMFGPVLGRVLGVDRRLLAAQLTSNLGRTLGTTVALTIGLGLYVTIQVWGQSMLQPFLPGDWMPDAMVTFQGPGLPDSEVESVCHARGVLADQCLALAVEQPRLASDITGSQEHASVTRQDNVVLVGLDAQKAFGGPHPVLGVEFLRGDRDEAIARLRQGRACLVPDYFANATGLGVGDRFAMIPPESPDAPVSYTIAGVIALPGSHMMSKAAGLRRRSGHMAALIFAPLESVRRDFGVKTYRYFWMNLDPNADAMQLQMALRPIGDRNLDALSPYGIQTESGPPGKPGRSVRLLRSADLRAGIQARAEAILWLLSQIPLITLVVTSLGVINTVMASVRARRWELGVLRALGLTRWGLFAMILIEGLLIGLVACGLSLAFGLMAGWCGTGISQHVSFFGGLTTPLIIPWPQLGLGFGLAMALCLAAALWPAIATGRTEPLRLLQAGRSGW